MVFEKSEEKPQKSFERPMFKGNWECADCGTKITEMPFKPSEDRPIYCRECYAKKRSQFRR